MPGWSQQDELLARLAETFDEWGRRLFYAEMLGKVKWPKPPKSVVQIDHPDRPEPKPPEKKRVTTDPAEIRRFFSEHLRR